MTRSKSRPSASREELMIARAPILRRPGNDLVHAAVRYLLSNKQLTAPIPGVRGQASD